LGAGPASAGWVPLRDLPGRRPALTRSITPEI
jgi:hypothetical protein